MNTGVISIHNNANGRQYITVTPRGCTFAGMKRWFRDLFGPRPYGVPKWMKADILEHGYPAFTFDILQRCTWSDCGHAKAQWIHELKPLYNGPEAWEAAASTISTPPPPRSR